MGSIFGVVLGQVRDLVDQSLGAVTEAVFIAFANRLAVEFGVVQYCLELAREFVALFGDLMKLSRLSRMPSGSG